MHHEVVCPSGHRVRVTEEHFGQQVKCPTCSQMFVVPEVPIIEPDSPNVSTGGAVNRLRDRWKTHSPKMTGLSLSAGRPMLAVGLLLVLISRGCGTVGQRGVDRSEAKLSIAQGEFDDETEAKAIEVQRQIDELGSSAAEGERRSSLQEKDREMKENRRDQRRELENGRWRDMRIAARDAQAEHNMAGYWREAFFVFASLILAAGLLVCSWNADGAERWVCMIMLAIITFSIYIGGVAWISLPGGGPLRM